MSELSEAAARSWAEHLRRGGTTSWRDWRPQPHPPARPESLPPTPVLPSAAHLALARRLNASGAAASVVDLVLSTPAAGRGRPDLSLGRATGLGCEPEDLPARELLRVAVPALADVLTSMEAGALGSAPTRARHRFWKPADWWPGRRFRVVGSSPHADAVRAALAGSGLREGGRRPTVLVVGAPLEAMMSGLWARRVRTGAGLRWRRVWAVAQARDELPAGSDLGRAVAAQVADVGSDRVHLLLERTSGAAVAVAGQALGVGFGTGRGASDGNAGPDMVATDLIRRVNQVTVMRLAAPRRRELGRLLDALVGSHQVPLLGVPPAHQDWATQKATRLAEQLTDQLTQVRCVVHGDPAVVVPSTGNEQPSRVRAGRALEAAEQALVGLKLEGDRWRAR